MGDNRIGPSIPPNIQTTDIEQPVEIPSEAELKPEVSTAEEPELAAGTEEAMNKAGTEAKGYLDTGGEYLKERLGEELVSPMTNDPDPNTDLQRMLQEVDPNQAEPQAPGQMTQQILERGMMQSQFAAPIALPNAAKGLVNVKLTTEQEAQKDELKKSPAWSKLTDAEINQIDKDLSKVSGTNLTKQVDKIKARLEGIETVSKHAAWNQLTPAQQQKIKDQVFKARDGAALKNELTKIGEKFDSIEKLSQAPGWSALNADQKAKLTDPVLTLSGNQLKTHLTQTQEKLDSLASFTKQPSWKQLQPADQQKIVDHILKAPQDRLKLTTENVQATIDFVATLRSNNVDPGKTLDKLLTLESQRGDYFPNPQKSFEKMKAALVEASTQINAAKDKKLAATDIRDMLNFSFDRTYEPGSSVARPETKAEIAQRFLKQYKNDPNDFQNTRTALNNTPDALLIAHKLIPNGLGVEIHGKAINVDLTNVKNLPAGLETKYKHAIGNLLIHEGPMDNINFWDDQILSLGVRQWSTYTGDLVPLLKEFQKTVGDDKFKELLPGITFDDKKVLYNGKAITGNPNVRGEEVRTLLGNLKQSEIIELSSMFNKLGKNAQFQQIELQDNVNRINRTLNSSVGSHKIGDYVKSDRGIGQLVSYEAFSLGYVQQAFNKTVTDLAKDLGLSGAPSRQELLDALKLKLEGKTDPKNPKNNIEADKAFIEKLQQKYGKDIVDKLKTDGGREAFLDKRLMEDFRDNFVATIKPPTEQPRFRRRYDTTEKYYDGLK